MQIDSKTVVSRVKVGDFCVPLCKAKHYSVWYQACGQDVSLFRTKCLEAGTAWPPPKYPLPSSSPAGNKDVGGGAANSSRQKSGSAEKGTARVPSRSAAVTTAGKKRPAEAEVHPGVAERDSYAERGAKLIAPFSGQTLAKAGITRDWLSDLADEMRSEIAHQTTDEPKDGSEV